MARWRTTRVLLVAILAPLGAGASMGEASRPGPAAEAFERSRHLLLDVRPFDFTAWKRELESVHSRNPAFDAAIAWECRRCALLFADSLPADSILQVVETAVLLREPMALDDSLVALCDRLGRRPPALQIARRNAAVKEGNPAEVDPAPGDDVRVDELPEAVTKFAPEYPDAARNAHVQGTVLLQVLVGKDGHVRDVRVGRSIPLLDDAAIAAARRWIYKPALANGEPVAVWVAVPLKFTLH